MITLMLLISFFCIYLCASYSLRLMETFPDVACDSLPLNESPESLQAAALREWSMNKALE